jgi:hypothetical protein
MVKGDFFSPLFLSFCRKGRRGVNEKLGMAILTLKRKENIFTMLEK